jgi:hypothetical protein
MSPTCFRRKPRRDSSRSQTRSITEDTLTRVRKFCADLIAALWHCAFEETEVFVPIGFIALFLGTVSIVGRIAYEMLLDPNSADVAAGLAQLSIDPTRWA